MNPRHLANYIVVPVLDQLGMLSLSAVRLMVGTAVVESDCGTWVRQLQGPALGVFQMEPATFESLWADYLQYRPQLAAEVRRMAGTWPPGSTAMVGNNWLACAMARLAYWRVSQPLPKPDDFEGLAAYHKRYYNTELGAARLAETTPKFEQVVKSIHVRELS